MDEPNSICYDYGYYMRAKDLFTNFADDPLTNVIYIQSRQV